MTDGAELPRWFNRLVVAVVALVVGYGAAGLVLALAGWCTPASVALAGTVLAFGLAWLGWPRDSTSHSAGSSRWAAAALIVAFASVWFNASNSAEHVIVNRDAGVYLVAGRWVADHGSLLVEAGRGPFGAADEVSFESSGTYDEGGGRLHFQFSHLLAVLLAEAYWLGGAELMVITPALIGAAALLSTYALAVRLAGRPWAGFLVTLTLAVCLPVLAVVRDTYSEGATWLLLTSGLWSWARAADESRVRFAAFGGLVLGAMTASRVDAVVYLLPIPALAGLMVALSTPDIRGVRQRTVNAFVIALVPGLMLGSIDVMTRSRQYYRFLHDDITGLWGALALSAAVGCTVRTRTAQRLARRMSGLGRWTIRRRSMLAAGGASAVVVVITLAWLVRPHFQRARGAQPSAYIAALQAVEGGRVEPDRSYAEMSLQWVAWYLGPATVGLAIAGAAIVTHRVFARRLALPSLVPWLALAGGTMLYVWQPRISPDHIWASRRFVPAVLPLVVTLAAVSTVSLVSLCRRRWPERPVRAAAAGAALSLVMVAPTTARSVPVFALSDQHGYLELVRDVCSEVHGGAVVAIDGERAGVTLPQTLRSFCGVPVALVPDDSTAAELAALADAWANQGCELHVVAASIDPLRSLVPAVVPTRLGPYTTDRALEVTLSRAPRRLVPVSEVVYLATVPPDTGEQLIARPAGESQCRA